MALQHVFISVFISGCKTSLVVSAKVGLL